MLGLKRVGLRMETWQPRTLAVLDDEGFAAVRDEASGLVESVRETAAQDLEGLDELAELSTLLRRTSLRLDTANVRSRLAEIATLLAALP